MTAPIFCRPTHGRRRTDVNLTNKSYLILMGTKNFTEQYRRDEIGWLKVSSRGRKFRMTAEQVLNHVLPALAGIKPNLTIKVEHHDPAADPGRHTLKIIKSGHAHRTDH